jgi:hypothetical protein
LLDGYFYLHPSVADSKDPYSDGARAARHAIAEGVPRWIAIRDRPFGQMIDPATGLPIFGLSAPAELAEWQSAYAQGHNETISTAVQSGEINVDFRPLLMSRPEVVRALTENKLGTLSTANPRLRGPSDAFVLKLRFPKPKAKTKLTWVHYSRQSGEEWPEFSLYDGPQDVAVGRVGRVLVFKTSCLFLTHDVVTTQVLNSYPL